MCGMLCSCENAAYLHAVAQIHPKLMQVLLTPQLPLSVSLGTGFHEPA